MYADLPKMTINNSSTPQNMAQITQITYTVIIPENDIQFANAFNSFVSLYMFIYTKFYDTLPPTS